jgi:predicted  nucleic acid-binding Zn-ribbon protein
MIMQYINVNLNLFINRSANDFIGNVILDIEQRISNLDISITNSQNVSHRFLYDEVTGLRRSLEINMNNVITRMSNLRTRIRDNTQRITNSENDIVNLDTRIVHLSTRIGQNTQSITNL